MASLEKALPIIQTSILQFFGFLPHHPIGIWPSLNFRQKVYSILSTAAVAILICGTFGSSCLQSAFFLYGLVHPNSVGVYEQHKGLLVVMERLPSFSINTRSLLILSVFLFKRNAFSFLLTEASTLIELVFSEKQSRQRLRRKLKLVSLAFLYGTFAFHVVWQYASWADFMSGATNVNLTSTNALAPLPLPIRTWHFLIIDCFFNILPFCLSQQVYVCGILSALVVSHCLQVFAGEIRNEAAMYKNFKKDHDATKAMAGTGDRLQRWERIHYQTLQLVKSVNTFFGLIFLITYGFDLLTMLGYTAKIVSDDAQTAFMYAFAVGSVAVFGVYTTVFPFPLVMAHEKCERLADELNHLDFFMKEHASSSVEPTDKHSYQLAANLRHFEASCRNQTWTFVFSFMLLAREVLHKEDLLQSLISTAITNRTEYSDCVYLIHKRSADSGAS
ncbi:hypothetical protein BV898_18275 [Hypsibius exemplaris]|uniref:Uncharacterized protein n=1 Tax=Hypsibius exemplaris TaxID=2072580 RepID=A0A9X6RNB3_HYPEX|nr:hypothetical protein BV898_18275 [Hypsibius exemplaris]